MIDESYETVQAGKEALETLRLILMDETAVASARVAAAKTLFDRYVPKQNEEEKRREAEERDAAIAEAKGILAEFAAAKSAGLHQPVALDQAGAPEPADAGNGA